MIAVVAVVIGKNATISEGAEARACIGIDHRQRQRHPLPGDNIIDHDLVAGALVGVRLLPLKFTVEPLTKFVRRCESRESCAGRRGGWLNNVNETAPGSVPGAGTEQDCSVEKLKTLPQPLSA